MRISEQPEISNLLGTLNTNTAMADADKWVFYKKYPYSVTKILDQLAAPFDEDKVAMKTYKAHFNDPDSIYYQKTVEEIKTMWAEKRTAGKDRGIALDEFIGKMLTDHADDATLDAYISSLNDEPARNKCNTFRKFYRENMEGKFDFIAREQVLIDPDTGVNGRLDALFGKDDVMLLVDWKNTEKIKTENPYEQMNGPLYAYQSTDLNKYTMQVYIYSYIIRKKYNVVHTPIAPVIIQVGETEAKPYVPSIPYSDDLVEKCIAYAIEQIDAAKSNK